MRDYSGGMSFEGEIAAAIGKRVSIRLHEGESFRDLLGVLKDEKTIIKKGQKETK